MALAKTPMEIKKDEILDEMNILLERIEDLKQEMEELEQVVAGDNAHYFIAVSRLVNTSASAMEEAITWLKGIEWRTK